MVAVPERWLERVAGWMVDEPLEAFDEGDHERARRARALGETWVDRVQRSIASVVSMVTILLGAILVEVLVLAVASSRVEAIGLSALNWVWLMVMLSVRSELMDRQYIAWLEGRAKRGGENVAHTGAPPSDYLVAPQSRAEALDWLRRDVEGAGDADRVLVSREALERVVEHRGSS